MASKALTPLAQVKQEIAAQARAFTSALPNHIPLERFQRTALTAIQHNPDLLRQDRHSLFLSLTKAATDGLLPDGREGALVPFKGVVQWMPMVAGVLKKVRQSGMVANWTAHAVFEKDEFDILYGDDDRIHHRPYLEGFPGKVTGAYSIVTFKDGSISKDYMPWWRIEKAKNAGGSRGGIWDKWPDEMAVKTVLRHHSKMLPQSTDIQGLLEDDETAGEADRHVAELAPPQGRAALAAAFDVETDPETGVIEIQRSPESGEEAPAVNGAGTPPANGAGSGAAPTARGNGWQARAQRYQDEVREADSIEALASVQEAHRQTLGHMESQSPANWKACRDATARRLEELQADDTGAGDDRAPLFEGADE